MKRFLLPLAACILLLLMAGCSGASAKPPEQPQPPAETIEPAEPKSPEEPVSPEEPDEPEEPAEPVPPEPPVPEEPYVRTVDPAKPMVALTFDDGPHGELTPILLDILEENHAVATFFEVGRNVWSYPEQLVRAEELGCELGSHSYAHKNLSKMSYQNLLKDLADTDEAFIAAVGHAPYLLRPPYGAVNKNVKYHCGRSVITWDIDTNDWQTSDPQVVIDLIADSGNLDGKIVLLHSNHASSVEAMRTVIPQLIEDGYQLVTVTELFAYYYGEVPQTGSFYGYSYFHSHDRTDTPAALPEIYPTPQAPSAPVPDPVKPPAAVVTPPAEETVPPTEETVPPVEETVPPTEETVPPAEGVVPPQEEVLPPDGENSSPDGEDIVLPPEDSTQPEPAA